MKKTFIVLLVVILAGAAVYYITSNTSNTADLGGSGAYVAGSGDKKPEDKPAEQSASEEVIGKSVEGRDITAYHFGRGVKEILFVAGLHGGYEWNTVLVAYELIDYLKASPSAIPDNVRVTVIPVLNPDGLNKVVGTAGRFTASQVKATQSDQVAGRFNANNVDLNRNFDCDWKSSGTWQSKTVSGGKSPFSEPESIAIKDYVEKSKPVAVISWFSSAGGVYSSSCGSGVSAETDALTKEFAKTPGYSAHKDFDSYEITGDMSNWLAKNNIPAISVLLTNHTDTDWIQNKVGVDAVLQYYSK